jgi:hypothetical protein
MILKIIFAVQMAFALEGVSKDDPKFQRTAPKVKAREKTFMETGRIAELEQIKNPEEKDLMMSLVLSGEIESPDRQKIIDNYVMIASPARQKVIFTKALSSATDMHNYDNADEILSLASRADSSKVAGIYCEYMNESIEKADFGVRDAKEVDDMIKDEFEQIYPIVQKHNLVNQPCGQHGTLRDIYHKHFPELEQKFAETYQAQRVIAVASVTDKQSYSKWKCTEKDIKDQLQQSLNTVNAYKEPNSSIIATDVPCRLYGKISRAKNGKVTFKLDENQMGIKFEVLNVKSMSDILGSMKKAKLLTEDGKPIVDEKQLESATKPTVESHAVKKPTAGQR